jgi:Ca2+-transporting ATPase
VLYGKHDKLFSEKFLLLKPNSEGETLLILANEVVPGDLVQFTTGDRIPADIRIIDAIDLEIDESSLTGEEDARRKTPSTCQYENDGPFGDPVALAERTCIGFMGTLVRNGKSTMPHD